MFARQVRAFRLNMHSRLWCTLALTLVKFSTHTTTLSPRSRFPVSRRFLFYRTNVFNQRPCVCSTLFSCSCCETVTILYIRMQKRLCSNFMYQRNGLNVDISLGTDTLKTITTTTYSPFKLCTAIPGSSYSSICVNVVELNLYSRSVSACVRHDIRSKSQEWQINYSCLGISTLLPVVDSSGMASAMITMATGEPASPSSATMSPEMDSATMIRSSMTAEITMGLELSESSMVDTDMSAEMTTSPAISAELVMRSAMDAATPVGPLEGGTMMMELGMDEATSEKPSLIMRPAIDGPTSKKLSRKPSTNASLIMDPATDAMTTIKTSMTAALSRNSSSANSTLPMIGDRTIMFIRSKRTAFLIESTGSSRTVLGRRRKSRTIRSPIRPIYLDNKENNNRGAGIVNGEIVPKLALTTKATTKAITLPLPSSKNNSIRLDAVTEKSKFGEIVMDSIDKPIQFTSATLYDRSQNFPSRIPPVVEINLKKESVEDADRDAVIFRTRMIKKPSTSDHLIFPD